MIVNSLTSNIIIKCERKYEQVNHTDIMTEMCQ